MTDPDGVTDPDDLLDAVFAALEDAPRPTRLGKVDPAYVDGTDPRVVWDGEDTATTKRYKTLGSYTPRADDRIVAVAAGSTWVILGRIGGEETWQVGDLKITSRASWSDVWLLCDGSTFDGATYPALQSHLGSTTLPDWRDRLPVGAGGDFPLGATGGSKPTNVAQHTHSNTRATSNSDSTFASGSDRTAVGRITADVESAGTTDTHGNYPPYRAVNVLIRAR